MIQMNVCVFVVLIALTIGLIVMSFIAGVAITCCGVDNKEDYEDAKKRAKEIIKYNSEE